MINSLLHLNDQWSIFQYIRTREYVGNRFNPNLRPERYKHHNGTYVRLKTAMFKEPDSPSSAAFTGLNLLERILLPSYGVTDVHHYGHQSELLWSYPSAGGSNPVEVYVVVRNVEGLSPGIYSYCALHTCLFRIAEGEALDLFKENVLPKDRRADFYFVLAIVPWRSCWKYSYKGYRFGLIDTGHVLTNFQLIIRTLGLKHSVYTSVDSRQLNHLLHLEPREQSIAIVAVRDAGYAGKSPEQRVVRETNQSLPGSGEASWNRPCRSDDSGSHEFDWEPISRYQDKVSLSLHKPSASWLSQQASPVEWQDFNRISSLISERRSSSSFMSAELAKSEFWSMLAFIRKFQTLSEQFYLIVQSVEGIESGIYSFDTELALIQAGQYREQSANLCLGQEFVQQASVLFFFAADTSQICDLNYSEYQQKLITAGMLGQLIYLKATEQKLGYSAIGGYYDEEVQEQLQLPSHLHILYAGALGIRDPDGNRKGKRDRYHLQKPMMEQIDSE